MTTAAFRLALERNAAHLGFSLSDPAARSLEAHFGLLRRWATKVNLTTVLEPEAAASLHYADSLSFLSVDPTDEPVIDVGTGAGFPGLVIAAVTGRPVILVEPSRKRTSFLRVAVSEMGLSGVRVVTGRLEPRDRTGVFPTRHVVVSRATFPPEAWLDRAPEALAPGGRLILSSGRGGPALETLEAHARRRGLHLAERRTVELLGGSFRAVDCWVRASDAD